MTIKQLHKNGTLKFLFERGYITDTVLRHVEYYETFQKYRANYSYRQACVFAANDHDVSIETIKRAVKGSVS